MNISYVFRLLLLGVAVISSVSLFRFVFQQPDQDENKTENVALYAKQEDKMVMMGETYIHSDVEIVTERPSLKEKVAKERPSWATKEEDIIKRWAKQTKSQPSGDMETDLKNALRHYFTSPITQEERKSL